MELRDQVINLELAKKLKELGVKNESIFVWEYFNDQCHGIKYKPYAVVPNPHFDDGMKLYSAFSIAELGEILPNYIQTQVSATSSYDGKYYLEIFKGLDGKWGIGYVMDGSLPPLICNINDTLVNIMAKSLIWLIENGHVKV